MDCFGQNKIIENNQCQASEIGAKFDIDKCVCDESMGYTGLNANQCDNCWGSSKIVSNGQCNSCQSDNIFLVDSCMCDEQNGYVSADPTKCTLCYSSEQILQMGYVKLAPASIETQYGMQPVKNVCASQSSRTQQVCASKTAKTKLQSLQSLFRQHYQC
ncbi:Hypothetical_protein [Hexamita inflata]|uniref:Hypothetical_protein n=1 Tax=Hexamita inflata TaxID=28002 RepID=A0AA86PK15_9EUKA|nr:Hypothetical protein HINF_LOCUS24850 [Hexamita inflata]